MLRKGLTLLLALSLLTACATPPTQTTTPANVPPVEISGPVATPTPSPEPIPEMAVPSVSPAPTVAPIPVEPTVGQLPDNAEGATMNGLFSWNPTGYTYHLVGKKVRDELFDQLLDYAPDPHTMQAENPVDLLGFLLIYTDGEKESYYVTETQLYSKERGVLDATPEQCKALHDLAVATNKEALAYPQWLRYMNPYRLTEVSFMGLLLNSTMDDISFTTADPVLMRMMAQELSTLQVNPAMTKKLPAKLNFNTPAPLMTLRLTFDSGVVYDVALLEDNLTVLSSDMDFSLGYTLKPDTEGEGVRIQAEKVYRRLNPDSCTDPPVGDRENPMTGKPVIYLYPQKATDVTVKLDFGGELWYTYPTIQDGGWNVTAYPDGRLVNKGDGTEHYYLFWDGSSNTDWVQDEGFCVVGGDTEAFLREKLAYMGLTPREYNDFITFWVPRLQANPYNLITFAGEQYEQLAPLTLSPAPDSVLRVHMVYKPLTTPQQIPEQKLTGGFQRKGFTMVEWGGSLAH